VSGAPHGASGAVRSCPVVGARLVEPVGLVQDIERFAHLGAGDLPGIDIQAGKEGPVEDGPDGFAAAAPRRGTGAGSGPG
jgi:hypothetical protein